MTVYGLVVTTINPALVLTKSGLSLEIRLTARQQGMVEIRTRQSVGQIRYSLNIIRLRGVSSRVGTFQIKININFELAFVFLCWLCYQVFSLWNGWDGNIT
jgi:hypothetical protein